MIDSLFNELNEFTGDKATRNAAKAPVSAVFAVATIHGFSRTAQAATNVLSLGGGPA